MSTLCNLYFKASRVQALSSPPMMEMLERPVDCTGHLVWRLRSAAWRRQRRAHSCLSSAHFFDGVQAGTRSMSGTSGTLQERRGCCQPPIQCASIHRQAIADKPNVKKLIGIGKGQIEYSHVTFHYGAETVAVDDVSPGCSCRENSGAGRTLRWRQINADESTAALL